MKKLKLTLACDQYDYLQPIRDGIVEADGIDLNLLSVESGIRHQRMNRYGEYDACEFSTGSHIAAVARGIDWLDAIPFFPRRMFCQRFIFVRADSDIHAPADLVGKRVGIIAYQNSLAIALKALLDERYDISASDVTWVATRPDAIETDLPESIRLEVAANGVGMEELLLSGEIDAMVAPNFPNSWLKGEGVVRRLFPEYEREEKTYFRQTDIFPIMHHVAIKREILEQHPWVSISLYEALLKSKEIYNNFIKQSHRLSFVWANADAERAFFGKSPFYQGYMANRKDLDWMIKAAQNQGIITTSFGAEKLFAKNVLGT